MIPTDLLELLRCPRSGQAFTLADDETLARLNARISPSADAGAAVRNEAGTLIDEPLTAALLREDRLLLYPIREDIPVLLAEEAIRV